MSTAKERYYSLIEDFEIDVLQEIIDYVTELEQELKDSELRREDLLTSLQRSNAQKAELEQEKAELKKAISFYYTYHKDSRNDGIIFEEFNKICPMK